MLFLKLEVGIILQRATYASVLGMNIGSNSVPSKQLLQREATFSLYVQSLLKTYPFRLFPYYAAAKCPFLQDVSDNTS